VIQKEVNDLSLYLNKVARYIHVFMQFHGGFINLFIAFCKTSSFYTVLFTFLFTVERDSPPDQDDLSHSADDVDDDQNKSDGIPEVRFNDC